MDRQFDLVYGYLALAKRPGNAGTLEDRIRLLVTQLAAERSGCRWCADRAHHDWRVRGLPVDLLRELDRHDTSDAFTEGERVALALVDSVACSAGASRAGEALARARRFFTASAVAELIACLAEHHLIADERP